MVIQETILTVRSDSKLDIRPVVILKEARKYNEIFSDETFRDFSFQLIHAKEPKNDDDGVVHETMRGYLHIIINRPSLYVYSIIQWVKID